MKRACAICGDELKIETVCQPRKENGQIVRTVLGSCEKCDYFAEWDLIYDENENLIDETASKRFVFC